LTALAAVARTRARSGVLGTTLLVVGASWVFGELVSAFNIIWGIEAPGRGGPLAFVRLTLVSYALILVAAFLLLVSLIISAVLTLLGQFLVTLPGGAVVWGGIQVVVNLGVLTGIFALLFKYRPQTRVEWRDVWLGAGLTAVLWSLTQLAIASYIPWSRYKDYGAVGAILALVTWVYLSSLILFAGGELTVVFARQYGSRTGSRGPGQPDPPLGADTRSLRTVPIGRGTCTSVNHPADGAGRPLGPARSHQCLPEASHH
jgi:membrane protein